MTRSVMIARASASTPWRRRMNLGRRRMVGSCLPVHYFAYQRPSQRYRASLKTWKSDLSPKRSTTNIKRAPTSASWSLSTALGDPPLLMTGSIWAHNRRAKIHPTGGYSNTPMCSAGPKPPLADVGQNPDQPEHTLPCWNDIATMTAFTCWKLTL
jgi:hypothetical protein